jgi:hypothetical protein
MVDDFELERRHGALPQRERPHLRGWQRIFADHARQADLGADPDVLDDPAGPLRPEIN